ncbi:MAG: hypothetical protein H6719_16485 [Sandaracinaceae bacterium]|nr:hypothetical protein [Sandaracinaceae bacterium]
MVSRRMEFRIPEPCPEPWEQMEPRSEGRHCRRCDRTLIDFTRMTRARAEAVARGLDGPVCGRLVVHQETGEPWFSPEAAVAPRWAGGVVLAAALTVGCGTQTRGGSPELAIVEPEEDLGPPMEPVTGPEPVVEAAPVNRAVPVAELDLAEDSPVPTPEQRRLTAAKQAALHPPIPQNHVIYDGFMF